MKNIISLFIFLLLPIWLNNVKAENIYSQIMNRICESELSSLRHSELDADIARNLRLFNDSSFSDIDYRNDDRTVWKPLNHLVRMKQFIAGYISPDSKYYKNDELHESICRAAAFWYEHDPRSHNWYYQYIATPQHMGVVMILMRYGEKKLPQETEANLIRRMAEMGGAPDQPGALAVGANKTDIATHWVYRGCLSEDKAVLEKGAVEAFVPIELTLKEGFQHDYSYMQHGPQLYIGGYGKVIVNLVCNLAVYLVDTEYALSEEKRKILSDFVLQTYLPSIRGKYFLYNVIGRSMTRVNALDCTDFIPDLQKLIKIDPRHRTEYEAAIRRLSGESPASYALSSSHRHYWRADYTRHQRPGYTFDVRMASAFTFRNENGNNEGIKGYFLSDGGNSITLDGDEYNRLFPVWDWLRIPGATIPEVEKIPLPRAWGSYGTSKFAGGVSDGNYGVTVYTYQDTLPTVLTGATKSWFFFDEEIVCLGAGINSQANVPVNTTLNQCLLDGATTTITRDNRVNVFPASAKGSHSYNGNLQWILHDGVGYYFPQGGNVVVESATQTGDWTDINRTEPAGTVQEEVFKAWITHGVNPTEGTYAYTIVPNLYSEEDARNYLAYAIEILKNTPSVQAVRHTELGKIGIAFYAPGSLSFDGYTLSVSHPCVLMLSEWGEPGVMLHIADPSRTQEEITVQLQASPQGKTQTLVCKLPTEKERLGATLSIPLAELSGLSEDEAKQAFSTGAPVLLPDKLAESSGIVYWRGKLWTHNDSGGAAVLYAVDPQTAQIVQTITLEGVTNVDWEDIAKDKQHLYIADTGNNVTGARTDLTVYKISMNDIPGKGDAVIPREKIEAITFYYPEQGLSPQPSAGSNNTAYDCEAIMVMNGMIHLFTKDWTSAASGFSSAEYRIPNKAYPRGEKHPAELVNLHENLGFLVTAVDNWESEKVILTGYQLTSVGVRVFSGFSGNDITSGNVSTNKSIGSPLTLGQLEGICFAHDSSSGYLSNEEVTYLIRYPAALRTFSLGLPARE